MNKNDLLKDLWIYGGYYVYNNVLYPECGFGYGVGIDEIEKRIRASYINKNYDDSKLQLEFERFDIFLSDDLALSLFDDIYVEGGYLLSNNKTIPYCTLRWDKTTLPFETVIENKTLYSLQKHERMQPILHNAFIGKYTVEGDY